jgi:deoxyadenosine/deoxycytidine kinase
MVVPKFDKNALIGIVGPCGSGKSTVSNALKQLQINAKHICQEHSYVPTMWQRMTGPDLLIFLDASYQETIRRRQLNWTIEEYQEQHYRLRHAREHANLYLYTDGASPQETIREILIYLMEFGIITSSKDY